MKKHFCDVCGKEFKWFNDRFYCGSFVNDSLELCKPCWKKIDKFIGELKKESKECRK